MILQESKEHSYLPGRGFRQMSNFAADQYPTLKKIGIDLTRIPFAMDSLQPTVTTGTIATPVQFLQTWIPGWVHIITRARKADEIVGLATIGQWSDEQIVQSVLELTGNAIPYGDYTNVPLTSWNPDYEYFTIVRFEQGMMAAILEEERSSRVNTDSASNKRSAASMALEVQRNYIAFYGFNSGNNRTYGFLNAPNLPAYVSATQGASTQTVWSTKTFNEITADFRQMFIGIRTSSGDTVDPYTDKFTFAVASNVVDFLTVVNELGTTSVKQYLNETYPGLRIVSAPELNAANGGANVGYLFVESIQDTSTDDGRVFTQIVPTKFRVLGVEQKAKGYVEDYTNATAGVFCKRPYGVYRITGL